MIIKYRKPLLGRKIQLVFTQWEGHQLHELYRVT